jgi:radical SAM protein with 4Fe4S-binding SPASM domain
MEEDLYYKIIDELAEAPYTSEILFELHNEPLLDRRTFKFIEYAKTRNKKKACTMVTNGQLINEYSLTEIKRSNLDKLIISLNAYSAEMYEHISGGFSLERLKNNIALVISEDELRKKLTLSFVATEQTAPEINQAIKYWKEKSVKVRTIDVSNRAGVLNNFESMKLKTRKIKYSLPAKIWKDIVAKILKVIGCYHPFFHMNILFNGDVIVCCHDWKRSTVIGNVKDSSLKDIWNSSRMNEIRRLILKKKYSEIVSCKGCSQAS